MFAKQLFGLPLAFTIFAASASGQSDLCAAPWQPVGSGLVVHFRPVGDASNARATWTWCFKNDGPKTISYMTYGYTDAEGDHGDIFPGSLEPGKALGGWAAFTSTGRPTRLWIKEIKFKGDDEALAAERQAQGDRRRADATRAAQTAENERRRDSELSAQRSAAQRQLSAMQRNLDQQRERSLAQYDRSDDADINREYDRLNTGLQSDGELVQSISSNLSSASAGEMRQALRDAIDRLQAQKDRASKDGQKASDIGSSFGTFMNSLGRVAQRDPNAIAALERKQKIASTLSDGHDQRANRLGEQIEQLRDQLDNLPTTTPVRENRYEETYTPPPAPVTTSPAPISTPLAPVIPPNVVRSSDGKWTPAAGYTWQNPTDANDLRVVRKPADIPSLGGRFSGMKFFGQSAGPLAALADRKYTTQFDFNTARYIGLELAFDFDDATSTSVSVPTQCLFKNGATEIRSERIIVPQVGWKGIIHAQIWGWAEPGHWPPGTYTVTCTAEGNTFGGTTFVVRPAPDIPSVGGRLREMKFYTRISDQPDVIANRKYARQFDYLDARYIGLEVTFDFDEAIAISPSISLQCLFKNGTTEFRTERTLSPQAGWKGIVHGLLWGWAEPGHWPAGTYTATCSTEGVTFGGSTFEVLAAPDIPSIGGRFRSMKFFAEDDKTPTPPVGQRKYTAQFDVATTQYVNIELAFQFDSALTAPVSIPIECVLTSGTIKMTTSRVVALPAGWTGFTSTQPWGWAEAGRWQPGTYRVDCTAERQTFGGVLFEIRN